MPRSCFQCIPFHSASSASHFLSCLFFLSSYFNVSFLALYHMQHSVYCIPYNHTLSSQLAYFFFPSKNIAIGDEVTDRECNTIHFNSYRHNTYVGAVKKLADKERKTFLCTIPNTVNPHINNAIVRLRGKMPSEHIGIETKEEVPSSINVIHIELFTIRTYRSTEPKLLD